MRRQIDGFDGIKIVRRRWNGSRYERAKLNQSFASVVFDSLAKQAIKEYNEGKTKLLRN